jgi:YHS domain-containing protein/thiol-disulfide isomerase/thioredoxin
MTLFHLRSVRAGLTAGVTLAWPLLAALGVMAADSGAIAWRQDLPRAREEARAMDRPIWIQFAGPWCHFCERMERESFIHPRIVREARESFVPVKLRADLHEALALQLGLRGLPATIILTPSGEELARHEGYLDPKAFHGFLRDALTRLGRTAPTDPDRAERPASVVALGGCCPVSLVRDHRLIPGEPSVTADHEGQVYRFADADARRTFLQKPEPFIPANAGRCPVAQVDGGEARPGEPSWSVLYLDRLYLCGSEESQRRFLEQPERYARVDVADRGFCPHCWAREGLLVRGVPRYSLTRDGRRYFFPDRSHLEAFQADTEVSRR